METVVEFLKEVRELEVPYLNPTRKEKHNAKSRLRGAQLNFQCAEQRLDLVIDKWKSLLEHRGVPRDVLGHLLTRDLAGEVSVISGVNGLDTIPVFARQYSPAFDSALAEKEFLKICQLVKEK